MKLTKAQRAALAYMLNSRGPDGDFRGGDFVEFYALRADAELRARGFAENFTGHHTTSRRHAWRRTGGRVLGSLHKLGLLRWVDTSWGTPIYKFTDEGRKAAEEALLDG